jgi:hypothetical protein
MEKVTFHLTRPILEISWLSTPTARAIAANSYVRTCDVCRQQWELEQLHRGDISAITQSASPSRTPSQLPTRKQLNDSPLASNHVDYSVEGSASDIDGRAPLPDFGAELVTNPEQDPPRSEYARPFRSPAAGEGLSPAKSSRKSAAGTPERNETSSVMLNELERELEKAVQRLQAEKARQAASLNESQLIDAERQRHELASDLERGLRTRMENEQLKKQLADLQVRRHVLRACVALTHSAAVCG